MTSPDPEQHDEDPVDEQLPDEQVVRLEVEDHGSPDGEDPQAAPPASTRDGQGVKLVLVGVILLLCFAAGMGFWVARQQGEGQSFPDRAVAGQAKMMTPEQAEEAWRTTGWKKDASEVLAAFMKAKSPAERMKYVIPNEGVLKELEMFYPEGRDDADTPVELFAHRTGNESDHQRGIFLMQYHQPEQIDIRQHFKPIRSMDKNMGIKATGLIDMAHLINEDDFSRPVAINAFFKKTDQGLKLDASVFIQSKFRTFKAFVDYPRPDKKQLFRVVIQESVDHDLRDDKRYRTYRLDNYAYPADHVNVSVLADSEVGEILSPLNWRGTNRRMNPQRTATVELGWSADTPATLQIERVICWQFLGVGGEIGNTRPAQEVPSAPVASPASAEPSDKDGE